MRTTFTLKDLEASPVAKLNLHLFEKQPLKKKSKYNNTKVFFDDHYFDSQKECNYYIYLRTRLLAGEITNLRLQVPYELNERGSHSLIYIADFVWIEKGKEVVCDVKGFKTSVYKKKRALMLSVHGIEIKEI